MIPSRPAYAGREGTDGSSAGSDRALQRERQVKKKTKIETSEKRLALLYMAPALLAITIFAIYPILNTIWLSLHRVVLSLQSHRFLGFGNYVRLLSDAKFYNAWVNTTVFTIASVLLETVLGFIIALLIINNFKGRGAARAAILIPWAIPTVVSSRMWEWIFNSNYGVMNYVLHSLGLIDQYQNWLGTPGQAMGVIIFVDVWKTTPFMALLILAGLTTIPREMYESAKIDGCNRISTFFRITLPLVRPVVMVAMLLRALDAFRVFDLVFIMTQGGPANSTEVLSSYTYKVLFSTTNFGYGSTLAVSMFLTVLVMALVFFAVSRYYERKEGV